MPDHDSLFSAIFKEASPGTVLMGGIGHGRGRNRALQQWLGYSASESQVMFFDPSTFSEGIVIDRDSFDELVKGHQLRYTVEKRYIHKNGIMVWGTPRCRSSILLRLIRSSFVHFSIK
jgi:two-component system CheB/CheR fusion protein